MPISLTVKSHALNPGDRGDVDSTDAGGLWFWSMLKLKSTKGAEVDESGAEYTASSESQSVISTSSSSVLLTLEDNSGSGLSDDVRSGSISVDGLR